MLCQSIVIGGIRLADAKEEWGTVRCSVAATDIWQMNLYVNLDVFICN